MRLAFAGTPAFAVPALDALHAAGHPLAAVFTQPDRPAGRGRRLSPSPVAERAAQLGVPVHKPERFREEALAALRAADVDAMVVVAYGLILPPAALGLPRLGCLNIHASLLPRWRGAAPIQRAIEAGDAETGVCIMQMEAGLDTGPVWRRAALPIGPEDTAATLHDALAGLGARLVVEALAEDLDSGRAPEPQPDEGITYARKLEKAEARLDWRLPAETLARRVRAFNPAPVAWTVAGETPLRVWFARALAESAPAEPGTVLGHDGAGLRVACGEGCLRIEQWQWPGGTVQTVGPAQAARLPAGSRLA